MAKKHDRRDMQTGLINHKEVKQENKVSFVTSLRHTGTILFFRENVSLVWIYQVDSDIFHDGAFS